MNEETRKALIDYQHKTIRMQQWTIVVQLALIALLLWESFGG